MTYHRPVTCGTPGCDRPAEYKIAALWSAGRFSELKTYGLACGDHYAQTFRDALGRRKAHTPSAGESVGDVAVFRLERGQPDRSLQKVQNPS
jgi:hypothetical protein